MLTRLTTGAGRTNVWAGSGAICVLLMSSGAG
jgi:hypothetical protein